jgi:hypothetical protein
VLVLLVVLVRIGRLGRIVSCELVVGWALEGKFQT